MTAFVERETKRFFSLCYLAPQISHSPCYSVDEFWHILLEDAEVYRSLCEPLGGGIAHIPNTESESHPEEAGGSQTVAEYRRVFGRVPRLWFLDHVVRNEEPVFSTPSFVIKLTHTCNIDCTYCYMFQSPGAKYKQLPAMMKYETATDAISRIVEFSKHNGILRPFIVLHGGEPLLVGYDFVRRLLLFSRDFCEQCGIEPRFSVQTNGALLDEEWVAIFSQYNVSVGVSLDGPASVNDAHRIDHKGLGTYDRVLAAMSKSGIPISQLGVIAVVKPQADGAEVLQHLCNLGFKSISFLLSDASHDASPAPDFDGCSRYLKSAFDLFWRSDDAALKVDPFEGMIKLLIGGVADADGLGLGSVAHVIIESDGGIAPLDSLRVCGADVYRSKGNVSTDAIGELFTDPLYMSGLWKDALLSRECLECPVGGVCGGGYIAHRYSRAKGFRNPSVYCRVLLDLIQHIQSSVEASHAN